MTSPPREATAPRAHQFSLEGRTALVTGSTTGLGLAIAESLGDAGAKVALNYFNDRERGEAAFEQYGARGAEGSSAGPWLKPKLVTDKWGQD